MTSVMKFLFSYKLLKRFNCKDQITLPLDWGILADYWVPYEIDSWNFQNLFGLRFHEISQNLSFFCWTIFKRKNPKKPVKNICEFWDPPFENMKINVVWMSSNFQRFHKTKQILKFSAAYLMWNPEICQDLPNQGQGDLVLLMFFWNRSSSVL